jgi:hypothetical protein
VNHKTRALLIGGVGGAVVGFAFAWVASSGGEDKDGNAVEAVKSLGPMEYFALAIAIFSLARQFGGMIKRA